MLKNDNSKRMIRKYRCTSHIIAVLYSLSNIDEFASYFINSNENNKIIEQLKDIFKFILYRNNQNEEIRGKKNEEGILVYDKATFMDFVKNICKDEEDYMNEQEPYKFYKSLLEEIKDKKEVYQLFEGEIDKEILCDFKNCKIFKGKKEFIYIEIYVNPDSISGTKIEENLKKIIIEEHLKKDYIPNQFCEKCKKENLFTESKNISTFPKILVFRIVWGFEEDEDKLKYKFDQEEFSINVNTSEKKFKLISSINYYKKDDKKDEKIHYISKNRKKKGDGTQDIWEFAWDNDVPKKFDNYEDKITIPYLLFYKLE